MKCFKNAVSVLTVFTLIVFMSGCNVGVNKPEGGKLKIITTLFPQYDFVREIAGDKAEIDLLLPPGMESHAYEPTPQDIVRIKKADAFIYTGENMEPWVHKVIENTKGDKLAVVDSSKNVPLLDEDHDDEHHENEQDAEASKDVDNKQENDEAHEHSHGGKDPHIWLNPQNASIMVDNILDGLVMADPQNESFYRKNAEEYKKKLHDLDKKLEEAFNKTVSKKIIYGGHFAFGYFAERFGLEYISPYNGFAPDAEPTPQRIAELIKNMNESGAKVIYYEELIEPKVAKVISDQTGAEMLLLHGAHNVTKKELAEGATYIKIMEENLEKLKKGLGYNE